MSTRERVRVMLEWFGRRQTIALPINSVVGCLIATILLMILSENNFFPHQPEDGRSWSVDLSKLEGQKGGAQSVEESSANKLGNCCHMTIAIERYPEILGGIGCGNISPTAERPHSLSPTKREDVRAGYPRPATVLTGFS
jgi:hypothetical protein